MVLLKFLRGFSWWCINPLKLNKVSSRTTKMMVRRYFLFNVNDISQAIKFNRFLNFNYSFLIFKHTTISTISDWFINNRLRICFCMEITKLNEVFLLLNLKSTVINTKLHSHLIYLGCILQKTLSQDSINPKVILKVNSWWKFLIFLIKKKYLTTILKRHVYFALIRP